MQIHFYSFLKIIPKNQISTYGDFAKFFGLPNHARYIGKLLNQNKNPDKYPCFKIVEASGFLGGFALGLEEKIKRLEKINISIKNKKIKNFSKNLWKPEFYNYFLGIPLDKKSQKKFKKLQNKIKKIIPEKIISLQNPETAHITINFLGKISLNNLKILVNKFKKLKFSKFSVKMEKIDFFGTPSSRIICFIDCKKGIKELSKLNKLLKSDEKQKFHPHITIFRIKDAKKFQKYENKIKKTLEKTSLNFEINKLRLYTAVGNIHQIPLIDFDNDEKVSVARAN